MIGRRSYDPRMRILRTVVGLVHLGSCLAMLTCSVLQSLAGWTWMRRLSTRWTNMMRRC
jgi:putative Ca2+/H+ antiporter (TMEM165/GDT1 family)